MNKKKAAIVLVMVFLLSITVTGLAYSFFVVKDVKVIPYDFSVGDYVGFNVDDDALHFGTALNNGQSSRNLIITNNYEHEVLVNLIVEGEGEELFDIEKNSFVLTPNENKKISLFVNIPKDFALETYSGKVFVITKKI